jgi:hypothetical protein
MKPFFVCARARARDSCTLAGEGGGDLGGGYTIITPSREVEETSWTCAGTAQSEDRRVDDSIVASLPLLSGCSCVSLSLSRLSTCLLSLSLSLSPCGQRSWEISPATSSPTNQYYTKACEQPVYRGQHRRRSSSPKQVAGRVVFLFGFLFRIKFCRSSRLQTLRLYNCTWFRFIVRLVYPRARAKEASVMTVLL